MSMRCWHRYRWFVTSALLFGSLSVALWLPPRIVSANTAVTVNDTVDEIHAGVAGCSVTGTGVCSLRDAVIFANVNTNPANIVTINLQPSTTYMLTIVPVTPDDATTGDLNFTSPTGVTTIVEGNTATGSGAFGWGGGITNSGGHVAVTNSAIGGALAAGNTAYYGGGVYSNGSGATLTLTNSTVQNNTATGGKPPTAAASTMDPSARYRLSAAR